jgi:hypothetical protein
MSGMDRTNKGWWHVESTTTQASKPIARPVMTPRAEGASVPSFAAGRTSDATTAPRQPVGTYVADTFIGDATTTSGGAPFLAQDGEPAGLARITLAMRKSDGKLPPAPRRLVGLCAWAAAVGVLGVIVAIWAGITDLMGTPTWFLPTAGIIGIAGVGATMGAFVTARRPRVPWVLLAGATLTLIIAIILTAIV